MTLDNLLHLKDQSLRPYVVVHCGSTTKAREAFEEWRLRDTLDGMVVLTIGANKQDSVLGITPDQAIQLDVLHLWKIEMADMVRIFNVGGYIGESTRRELEYAQRLGKHIVFLEHRPITLPGIRCSACHSEKQLFPCVYCGNLVCRACSFDTDERDTPFGISVGEWMCADCSCK